MNDNKNKKFRYLQIRDPEAISLAAKRAKKERRSLCNAGAISIIEHLSPLFNCEQSTNSIPEKQEKSTEGANP